MWWQYLLLLPVAVVLWLLYEWLEHTWVQYTTTPVECRQIQKNKELKICLITDLHNNRKNFSGIFSRIRTFSPDVVLLAGDMLNKHKEKNTETERFLSGLSECNFPVYYSLGNHELSFSETYPERWSEYLYTLPENITVLENTAVPLTGHPDICISGLSLPGAFYKKGKLYRNPQELPDIILPKHTFHIMMAHHPEYDDFYKKYQAHLIVSGHLHGGLLRLPYLGGVISPRYRLPAHSEGVVELSGECKMIISRGLGSHTIPLRFFNRTEVNFIVLRGTKK